MTTKRVILWTAPRCVSCAFERSVRTRKTAIVFHEPYSSAYYFGPERQSLRYQTRGCLTEPILTYSSVNLSLQAEYVGKELVFSKDMAYYVENKFDMFLDDKFKGFEHTFLIRDPTKAVSSLYRLATDHKKTGWDHFDPAEAGFRQMYQLYEFLQQHKLRVSAVVDADDLLDSPEAIMKSYCEAVGITFKVSMMCWEEGPVPEWGEVWPGWYDSVNKSTGFDRKVSTTNSTKINLDDLPKEVTSIIEKSRSYYDKLYEVRLKPKMS